MLEDRRAAFCARLKTLRESKGITLEAIAASTKIGRSLLKGLEENDLSRWPHGIYRRAYVRDYLKAIDLLDESVVAEFFRLFPGETSPCLDAPPVPEAKEPCVLALTLAEGQSERFARARTRIAAATIDLTVVLALSGAAWWVLGADIWASGALVALGYYSIGTAALGRSAGSRILEDHRWRRPRATATPAALAPLPGQPEPAMTGTGGLVGVLVAGIIRTLFLR